ncbi:hypothetical protein ACFOZ7_05585 [Natribaculum luteum]|uniref:Uncharacterized protein n=1 Tax=Natribaculum luteum TaxID=1586232 RepID=A0ABD5NXP9_9EURY|nr:hypothetical protein [Natribaculum luteum]
MGFPKFDDSNEQMVKLLAQIAANTGSLPQGSTQPQVQQSGPMEIDPRQLHVVETPLLEEANPDGTVTIEPGEEVTIAEYDTTSDFHLIAAGATNQGDVYYRIRADYEKSVAGGWRVMPMGTMGSPYSFVKELGVMFPIEEKIVYEAKLAEAAESTVDVSGKLYLKL